MCTAACTPSCTVLYRGPEDIERTGPYDERGPSQGDAGRRSRSGGKIKIIVGAHVQPTS